ncbi:MAG: hypothetical protein MR210_02395 [Erysipelotrichaceae bacterium]|nr:hypothetical protein [Erysipelotrichaceae bacterium]MDY5251193.1 hypothetical protein [Erysipelotrichaceae bacterium]
MKKKSVGVGIGTCSLMMIFTVLCLTIFAVLSLLQANASYVQSINYANSLKKYYDADSEAMKVKAMIENGKIDEQALKDASYHITEYKIDAKGNISFHQIIDEDEYIDIVLDKDHDIVKWRVVNDIEGEYGNQGFDF